LCKKYINGATYRITNPKVEGCTPSETIVTGTMPAHDLTVNVVYSRNTYTLTVNYWYNDGSQALPQQVFEYKYKEPYNIIPPEIPNYVPQPSSVSGNMPARDFPTNFIYVPYGGIVDPETPL